MLPITRNDLVERRTRRTNWRHGSALENQNQTPKRRKQEHASWPMFSHPSKFTIAIAITVFVLITQILIIHYYIGSNSFTISRLRGNPPSDELELANQYRWVCLSFPHLKNIIRLAERYGVELVIVDPDFLHLVESLSEFSSGNQEVISFSDMSRASSTSRTKQEPGWHKSIIHLAAINETSGGQPNLKLFYNALKHSDYVVNKYNDASETMQPEVYKRPMHLFDDDDGQSLGNPSGRSILSASLQNEDEQVSKIYTEFISHLFVVNNTAKDMVETVAQCTDMSKSGAFVVLHILVLYNYEYQPEKQWIQSSLHLDEIEKHRLLSYGLHSMDFRLPMQQYYIHPKRPLVKIQDEFTSTSRLIQSLVGYRLLKDDRVLHYVNNTYAHCKNSMFNITRLLDSSRRLSNYLMLLDSAQPLQASPFRDVVMNQVAIGLKFMEVFSKTYGSFAYWITGSTLLAYHKFCELVLMPTGDKPSKFSRSSISRNALEEDESDESSDSLQALKDDIIINLELGIFADELNITMLEDLSRSNMIGITMISDWRKPNGHISFHVSDCPNLIFKLYPYERRRDFYQYYFITRNSMILNHRFRRKKFPPSLTSAHSLHTNAGHHVFTARNLDLCLTRIDKFHPFRVPCDVHDHLRRIYII